MTFRKAERLRHRANDGVEAPELDGIADRVEAIGTSPHQTTQAPIRAELIADTCTAFGIMARGSGPVLALCRQLAAAGFDPGTPLEAWRGDVLCLHVRSIGEGAALTVEDRPGGGNGMQPTRPCTTVRS